MEIIKKTMLVEIQDMVNIAKNDVFGANEALELTNSVNTYATLNDVLKKAKAKLKELEAEPKKQIKQIETLTKELEKEIKNKVKEIVKVETKQKMKVNSGTGEATFVEVEENNLGKGLFIYSAPKQKMVVDFEAITPKTHPHLFTLQIDMEKVKAEPMENLPTKTEYTKERIGIQKQTILKGINNGN